MPTSKEHAFLEAILQYIPHFPSNYKLIILTHLIPNFPEFLSALKKRLQISLIIAIPYSLDKNTYALVRKENKVITPTLEELSNQTFILNLIKKSINKDEKFIIHEIGGFFSGLTEQLKNRYANDFVGIVEDTEAGHKKYLEEPRLRCPVVSVARSALKLSEDFLIGDSCLRASLYVFNENKILFSNRTVLVLGFGKIGRAVAYAAKKYGAATVLIYDTDPVKMLLAFSEGFSVGKREELLLKSDVIFGATASKSISMKIDYKFLKEGTILVSCSSRQVEFSMEECELIPHSKNIDVIKINRKKFFLLAQGYPINFIGNFLIGPMIRAMHAEILFAIHHLLRIAEQYGLAVIPIEERTVIAQLWLEHFAI